MDARAIALAVPLFFIGIGIELAVARRRRLAAYAFADSIGSLACGIGQQALAVLAVDGVKIGAYALIHAHLRVTTIAPSWWSWLVLLFAVDLGYWLYHWASHRVNFFWATHSVHHQSEEYNLSTALRQSWFSSLTSWIFYAPIAIAGFPTAMFVAMTTINTLYQFWIHTRLVGRLGVLEWFLNTPSHHRVHHGTDPRYLDKNYAGIFIIWDKLFGTFTPERGEPVYGTVKPLASWNALWANLEPFERLLHMSRHARRWRDKLFVWLAPPEWRPADLGGPVVPPEVDRATQAKYETRVTRATGLYVSAWFAVVAGVLSLALWYGDHLSLTVRAAITAWVIATLAVWGGLLEERRWAVAVECARLASSVAVASYFFWATPSWGVALALSALLAAGSFAWLLRLAPKPRRVETPTDPSPASQDVVLR
jgi:sterol desaturase/sphingolipid hydroxylase (fatty acid hydroxylase superfamily)